MLCVDEKSQIQALDRTAPILPMLPGTPQRATHDYKRAGTSSLYAALDIATGKVIGALHARHRAIEFKKFLKTIDREVPARARRAPRARQLPRPTRRRRSSAGWPRTPASSLHFTPTSCSWLNLVERWFAELTTKKLRRGAHRSVRQLNADIRAWIETWNDEPRPSSGPRPPTRSSTRSPATATESTITTLDGRFPRPPGAIGAIEGSRGLLGPTSVQSPFATRSVAVWACARAPRPPASGGPGPARPWGVGAPPAERTTIPACIAGTSRRSAAAPAARAATAARSLPSMRQYAPRRPPSAQEQPIQPGQR